MDEGGLGRQGWDPDRYGRFVSGCRTGPLIRATQLSMTHRIFGCFPLQEIGTLAHRSDPSDAITETISLTTELEMDLAGRPDEPENRALIMSVVAASICGQWTDVPSGLGVGIAAASFARKGYEVDIVGE